MSNATIEKVERADLQDWQYGRDYYRVSGSKISGTFAVGMTSHDITAHRGDDVNAPAMVVNTAPDLIDAAGHRVRDTENHCTAEEPFTVNGKSYRSQMIYVDFYPAEHAAGWKSHGRPHTVNTVDGFLVTRYSLTGLTDAARKTVDAAVLDIAAEYLTGERWLRYLYRRAAEDLQRAETAASEAHAAVIEAGYKLTELRECAKIAGVKL